MRREHTERVSKDAYEVGQGEVKWFHHGCITILVVSYLKRCLEISTECSHLSNVIPQRRLPRLDLAMLAQHHLGATLHTLFWIFLPDWIAFWFWFPDTRLI